MTKKELQAAYERACNDIEGLTAELECIKRQKNALVHEVTDMEKFDKAADGVFLALAENLTKSLKSKQIVNMKQEERDNLYYLLESFEKSMSQNIAARLTRALR